MNEVNNKTAEMQKDDFIQSRKKRNIALGLSLVSFIIVIYFVTIFKLGSKLFI
jgi:hypothetical protein